VQALHDDDNGAAALVILPAVDIVQENERQTELISPKTTEFSEADEKVLEQLKARFSLREPDQ
jgi:hypothetical protein